MIVSADAYFETAPTCCGLPALAPTQTICGLCGKRVPPPGYAFDPAKLGEAHGWALQAFIRQAQSHERIPPAMDKGRVVIMRGIPGSGKSTLARSLPADYLIVDNTNITIADLAPYASIALAYGLSLRITTIRCDPVLAHRRNTHGVPLASVERMARTLDSETSRMPARWKPYHEVIEAHPHPVPA